MAQEKMCGNCFNVKPLTEFHMDRQNRAGGGRHSYCKKCRSFEGSKYAAHKKLKGHWSGKWVIYDPATGQYTDPPDFFAEM